MPTCLKCSTPFPNRTRIDGVLKNLGNRKYCLSCSPWGEHNTKDIHTDPVPDGFARCSICKEVLIIEGNFYSLGRGGFFHYCKSCDKTRQNARHLEFKRQAVEYKGGSCLICGYARCLASLDFHHLDPNEKEFKIGNYKRPSMSDEIRGELDKCVLLCKNCHSEVHAGVAQLVGHLLPKQNVEGLNPFVRSSGPKDGQRPSKPPYVGSSPT
jgi:hypothetical protein